MSVAMWNCHSWPLHVSSHIKLLCLIDQAVYLPPIYMYCIRFTNDTDLVYQYARHLCSIDGGSICLLYLYVFYMHWYFLIFSYKLTVSNGLSLMALEKWRVHSVLWQFQMGGSICLWYLYVFYMHWYFLIFSYKLTVLNGLSLTTLKMDKFTLCSGSFKGGVYLHEHFICQLWTPGHLGVLINKVFLLCKDQWNCHSWLLHVNSNIKLPFLTTKCH